MFTNQVEKLPDVARQGRLAAEPDLTNPIPEIYPVEVEPPRGRRGRGLFVLSNGGSTGRSKSTGFCAGLLNCW